MQPLSQKSDQELLAILQRKLERKNIERVLSLQKQKRNSKYIAFGLGFGVIGIYLYSINAVKQEKVFDD